ncbi:DUF3456 domain-containing protein [Citrus sinensis]|uniref:DUF3456 domain-containing protein n=1 Tax=Citrus sinensis TaxID=2711 RepID=A0ACB8KYY9_CITSI|nr:DUF3456 domain-containing protein [Citrus sinensis]KAH9759650.1 DUF3456 domain-containing protein [Citrus sinensis]
MAKSVTCLVITLAIFSVAASIDEKCGACNAVAEELERGLSKEKTRNHLDLRHRLDSKGQREGKLIDYRVSELRVVELLDGLCDKMQDYTLEKVSLSFNQIYKYFFVSRLLEETEDELAKLIKKGSLRTGDVSKVLCEDLSKHCNKSR